MLYTTIQEGRPKKVKAAAEPCIVEDSVDDYEKMKVTFGYVFRSQAKLNTADMTIADPVSFLARSLLCLDCL